MMTAVAAMVAVPATTSQQVFEQYMAWLIGYHATAAGIVSTCLCTNQCDCC
jgi:hypothetical protein